MMEHLMQGSTNMANAVRLMILFQVFSLVGCLVPEEEMEIGTNSQSLSTMNGLVMNGLVMNGLVMNGLVMNGLIVTDVVDSGLSSSASTTLASTQDGASLLHYLVQCALPAGDAISVNGATYNGLFGIAPAWKSQPLTGDAQEAVTACLLGSANYFGVSVWISGRMHGFDDTTADERHRFMNYEGSFYGNVFSATQYAYACAGNTAPDFSVEYPNHDLDAGDRLIRRCADPSPSTSGQTLCGMTFTGKCSDVCDTAISGSHSNCWPSADRAGTQYPHTMSTWLLHHDDEDSSWPLYYDSLYGP
jgi:hypothetical protein